MFSIAKGTLRAPLVSEIEGNAVHCAVEFAWSKVGVDLGIYDATVSEQLLYLVERDTVLYEPAGEGVAKGLR